MLCSIFKCEDLIFENRTAEDGCATQAKQIKDPEVLLTHSSRPVARVRPLPTCATVYLPACARKSCVRSFEARAPGSPPTGKIGQRLGILSCLRLFVPVLLDQQVAIDPYPALRRRACGHVVFVTACGHDCSTTLAKA